MEYKVLTKEDIQQANDYVNITDKMEFVTNVAMRCFDTMTIGGKSDNVTGIIDVPPMYKENLDRKSRYLMGAFAKFYLNAGFETEDENDEWLMSVPDYDYWQGGHVMNQIDRFKSDAELRNKCFDIISDYKDIEKKLNAEIFGLLHAMNDSVSRLVVSIESSSTPQSLQKGMEQLEAAKKKLDEYTKARGETNE